MPDKSKETAAEEAPPAEEPAPPAAEEAAEEAPAAEEGPAFQLREAYQLNRRLLEALREREGSVPAQRAAVVEVLGLDEQPGPTREGVRAELAVQAALFAYESGLNHTQTRVYRRIVDELGDAVASGEADSADGVFSAFGALVRRFVAAAGPAPGDPDRDESERLDGLAEAASEAAAAAAAAEEAAAAEPEKDKKKGKKKGGAKESAEEAERAAAQQAAEAAAREAETAEREASVRLAEPRVLTAAQVRAIAEEVSSGLCAHFTLYRAVLRPGFYEPRSHVAKIGVTIEGTVPLGEPLEVAEAFEARLKAGETARAAGAEPTARGEAGGEVPAAGGDTAPEKEADEAAPAPAEAAAPEDAPAAPAESAAGVDSEGAGAGLAAVKAELDRRLEDNRRGLEERLARLEQSIAAN